MTSTPSSGYWWANVDGKQGKPSIVLVDHIEIWLMGSDMTIRLDDEDALRDIELIRPVTDGGP